MGRFVRALWQAYCGLSEVEKVALWAFLGFAAVVVLVGLMSK
jgi:hypothetical protein